MATALWPTDGELLGVGTVRVAACDGTCWVARILSGDRLSVKGDEWDPAREKRLFHRRPPPPRLRPVLPSFTGDVATGTGCDSGGRGQTSPPARALLHVSGRRFWNSDVHGLPWSLVTSKCGSSSEGWAGVDRVCRAPGALTLPVLGPRRVAVLCGRSCVLLPLRHQCGDVHASAEWVKPGSPRLGVAEASPQTHCSALCPGTGAAWSGDGDTAVTELSVCR